jgi:hypothetical protein
MNTNALKHVRKMWNNPLAPANINRANQRKWVQAIRKLGDRWLLAQPIERKTS